EELAGFSRLAVGGWKAEVTEQKHGVGSRGPLWRIKSFGPCALRVLPGEETCSPPGAGYLLLLSLDFAFARSGQITQGLPANGWVAVEQPLKRAVVTHA